MRTVMGVLLILGDLDRVVALTLISTVFVFTLGAAGYQLLEHYSPTDKQVERERRRRKVMTLSGEWWPVTYECEECGRLYEVLVNAAYYPLHDRYDPCPKCGHQHTKEER